MKWMQFLTPVAGMDAEEARAYMRAHKEGTYTLLDVRQPSEYEKGRIPGASSFPCLSLRAGWGSLTLASRSSPIELWGRSRAAAQYLAGQGFQEVYNLKGGIAPGRVSKPSGLQRWE